MLLALCVCLLAAGPGGCASSGSGSGSETTGRPQTLSGPWEYRWGDSPKDAAGRFSWTQTPADPQQSGPSDWKDGGSSMRPGGRGGSEFLWLRTRLPGPAVANPTLYFLIVEQLFEAYLDDQLLYRFGTLDGDGKDARRFLGNRTHMIPLPPDYAGKRLTLRIYSGYNNIGVSGEVRVGAASAIIATMVREDAGSAAVGSILCAVGLFAIGLFLLQRSDSAYLYYGCFAFSIGMWILCQMQSRTYLVEAPLGWLTLEIFALYAAVTFFVRYVLQVFGRGPLGLSRILSYLLFGYLSISVILVGLSVVPLLSTLLPFHLLMLVSIVYTLIMMAIMSLRGHPDARLFAFGFLFSALFGVHDILAVQGLLPRSKITFSQFGQGAFVLCLGLILARRFRLVHLTLSKAEKTLAEKVASLEEKNVEVQQLNDDLRRQIEARSKDLAASILDASNSFSELEVQVLSAGFLIAERYKVIRLIGQGGMGTVYEVERITDGRHFAAKVLSVKAGKQVLARFAREAQLLAKLKHPNLVTIQDVDMTQSHMAYIVMELVTGRSLAALSSSYGDLVFARRVLRQVADALATVHGQGIVHRDLKPENVLIQNPEDREKLTAKLVDFGVSMILDDNITVPPGEPSRSAAVVPSPADRGIPDSAFQITVADGPPAANAQPAISIDKQPTNPPRDRVSTRPAELTQTGVIMGTPLYMAPELRHGAKFARPSSDIFSFGVMAYELYAGQLPSEQPAIFRVFHDGKPWFVRLEVKCPSLPSEVAAIIDRCLDPRPEHRPTAAELKATLSTT